jgi:hypothetical protein
MKEGWVAGLRAALPDANISNRSIGASPGTQFATMMGHDFASFDFVFFDSVPNDEQRFFGSDEVDYLNRICFEMASTIAAKTNLIILGFCLDRFLNKPTEIFSARRNIASAVNAQFVDIRQLVISRGPPLLGGLPLYEQEAHPHRQFSRRLGYELGQSLLRRVDWEHFEPGRSTDFSANFVLLDLTKRFPTYNAIERKNSLLSQRLFPLSSGAEIEINATHPCVGFYVNRSETRAYMYFDGRSPSRVKLSFADQPGGLALMFVGLKYGIIITKLRVTGREVELDDAHPSAKVELGVFSFWSGDRQAPIPVGSVGADSLQLHDMIDQRLQDDV